MMAAATTVTLDVNTIILAVIGLVPAICTGLVTIWLAKIAAVQKEIHVAVNSGKTAMENQIAGLNRTVLELSGTIKTLEENKRGAELAMALATIPPAAVLPPAVNSAVVPVPVRDDNLAQVVKDAVKSKDT